jgi:hypothetical protein
MPSVFAQIRSMAADPSLASTTENFRFRSAFDTLSLSNSSSSTTRIVAERG